MMMQAAKLPAVAASSTHRRFKCQWNPACSARCSAHTRTHLSRRQRFDTEARQPPLTAVRLTSRRVRLVSASTHGMLCTNTRVL